MPAHKWTFKSRFRANAYGWKGTALATKRLKEAVSEIKKVAKSDPVTAADGAVGLMERIWPALQGIDSSSGSLGNAVNAHRHLRDAADRCGRLEWVEAEVDQLIERGTTSDRQEYLRVLILEHGRHA
jgi:hypothetical protein